MSKYLDAIHKAIGDYTDTNSLVEDAARELAQRLDWYHNAQMYRDAANELIPVLAKIDGTESIRKDIANKIMAHKPFDIDGVKDYIAHAE